MNNIERAARAIQPYEPRNGTPRDVAIDLAAAGLLAPDLPEPTETERFPQSACWEIPPRQHVGVRVTPDNQIKVCLSGELTPDHARHLAHALLAAANHAREHDAS